MKSTMRKKMPGKKPPDHFVEPMNRPTKHKISVFIKQSIVLSLLYTMNNMNIIEMK